MYPVITVERSEDPRAVGARRGEDRGGDSGGEDNESVGRIDGRVVRDFVVSDRRFGEFVGEIV